MVQHKAIKIRDKIIDLSRPRIMGIVNLTPDSFYSGSRVIQIASVLQMVEKMVSEGVDIIDIGAISTRPGSKAPSISTEIERLMPALKAIRHHFPDTLISIDTYRSEVLTQAMTYGVDLVNDISAGKLDESFIDTVAKLKLPYILMHMKGTPTNMADQAEYDDIVLELLQFFSNNLRRLRGTGIVDIIIDPGIGFGKSPGDSFKVLRNLESFQIYDLPVLVGLSRKSFIYKTLQTIPENALNGTTAMHMLALAGGANILRVHDVAPAVECVRLWSEYCT